MSLNERGNYGVKGSPSDTAQPPGRSSAASWADSQGNLWMFGGGGQIVTCFSDLWKYTISTNQWTWVNGSSVTNSRGIYGKKGVASSTNNPGGRSAPAAWTDTTGTFWLFGGYGYDFYGNEGDLNDLWKYVSNTNEWTWVSGDSVIGSVGSYGTLGNPLATNAPPARSGSTNWVDKTGKLWMFGGNNEGNVYNDLWKYDVTANEWTWMNGSDTGQAAIYGTPGTPAAANTPGARQFAQGWMDENGDFFVFGGEGYAASGAGVIGMLNDFWKYSVDSNQWAWLGGATITYPANEKNWPPAENDAVCWTDTNGVFWMYGGAISAELVNSLWRYGSDSAASVTATVNPVNPTSLTVYPNPSAGQFTVNLPEAAQVTIYSTLGDLIVTENLPKGKQPLNLINKPAGVYYLKANSSNGQQAVKLVVE